MKYNHHAQKNKSGTSVHVPPSQFLPVQNLINLDIENDAKKSLINQVRSQETRSQEARIHEARNQEPRSQETITRTSPDNELSFFDEFINWWREVGADRIRTFVYHVGLITIGMTLMGIMMVTVFYIHQKMYVQMTKH
ncbi:uncharacterized protein LOC106654862 [Trichogramma pretiosum]|uniref:uncharacterized protein LOC106654862 n=1 Tax=Trichogramma pretiosum TaxID=7493 RepID=UPI0006C9589F|nr:uncharacterized protein LOC106654862 [Trichogramma pretiosum]